jgi:hypothetical protein
MHAADGERAEALLAGLIEQLADAHAQRLLEESVGSEVSNWEGSARCVRASVDAHLGRVDAAVENAERAAGLARSISDRQFLVQAEHVLGFLALSRGDADEAVRRLAPLPVMVAELGVREPMVFAVGPDLGEALVLTGALMPRARYNTS